MTLTSDSAHSWHEVQEFDERSCFIPTLRCGRKSDAFAFRDASAESGVMIARGQALFGFDADALKPSRGRSFMSGSALCPVL